MSQQKVCKTGPTCAFLKAGTCKFAHQADPKAGSGDRKQNKKKVSEKVHRSTAVSELMRASVLNRTRRLKLMADVEKAKSAYFDVKDSKDVPLPLSASVALELKLLDDELAMLKTSVKSMFKNGEKFKLTVFYKWELSIAVTTGIVTGVQNVDPSSITEWVAAASLFDEYKIEGLELDFRMKQAVNFASAKFPLGVVAYDPTDNTGLTTITAGMSKQQHHLFNQPSTYESVAGGKLIKFHVRVPVGNLFSTVTAAGNWLPVGAPLPFGYLLLFCEGDYVLAAPTGGMGGMVSCHCEFRIRE